LRDLGNTIIVVEHDEDTIYSSDYIVDIGPGAGMHGGEVVVADYLEKLLTAKKNDLGLFDSLPILRGEERVPCQRSAAQREGRDQIRGGKIFNIKHYQCRHAARQACGVTGVSGSGKSSFVYEILYKNLAGRLEKKYRSAETFNAQIRRLGVSLAELSSSTRVPIGRTPRSNPATYTGAFTFIRDLFAESPRLEPEAGRRIASLSTSKAAAARPARATA
jgi:excinuclease ABC subunit A